MNKENCALKLVDEIILYYDARSKKHQNTVLKLVFFCISNASLTLERFLYKFPGHAGNLTVYFIEKMSELCHPFLYGSSEVF